MSDNLIIQPTQQPLSSQEILVAAGLCAFGVWQVLSGLAGIPRLQVLHILIPPVFGNPLLSLIQATSGLGLLSTLTGALYERVLKSFEPPV